VKKLVVRCGTLAFEERSCLPLAAACLVAGSVRERLASLLGAGVALCVLEPEIPNETAWEAIGKCAHVYRMRGSVADAAIVLRDVDAKAVAAAAFGEESASSCDRELSTLEREMLDRTAIALAASLGAICGEQREIAARSAAPRAGDYTTYFELAVGPPVEARIGIALSCDPAPDPVPALTLADLSEVALDAAVSFELRNFTARRLVELAPGDVVPITRASALRGSLRIGGRTLAVGTCGVRDGRYALEIEGCTA